MSEFFRKSERLGRSGRVWRGEESARATDLPLDHQLSFSPERDERWTFRDNRVFINDVDVQGVLRDGANDPGVLSGLSCGLQEYQQHVWSRGGRDHAKFNGVIASLQDTILGRMGSLYDGLTVGIRFECAGEEFWINNVNVRSVLALYRLRPTDKARRYLLALQHKLGLILSRQHSSTRYDGIHDRARDLFLEISAALEFLPADAPACLCDGGRCA